MDSLRVVDIDRPTPAKNEVLIEGEGLIRHFGLEAKSWQRTEKYKAGDVPPQLAVTTSKGTLSRFRWPALAITTSSSGAFRDARFARAAVGRSLRPAEAIHSAALGDVHDEFATVIDTGEILKLAEASIPSEMPKSTRVVAVAPVG